MFASTPINSQQHKGESEHLQNGQKAKCTIICTITSVWRVKLELRCFGDNCCNQCNRCRKKRHQLDDITWNTEGTRLQAAEGNVWMVRSKHSPRYSLSLWRHLGEITSGSSIVTFEPDLTLNIHFMEFELISNEKIDCVMMVLTSE